MKLLMFNKNLLILVWVSYACKCSDSRFARTNQCNPESDIVNEGNLNETCYITSTGQKGAYKLISDCPKPCTETPFEHLRCGYSKRVPIVCCPVGRINRTISAMKCDEYKEYACETVNTFTAISTPAEWPNCAHTAVEFVSGGEEAKPNEFPHMALVGYIKNDTILWNGGGSLISEQFVLTAAHIFDTRDGMAEYVRVGEHRTDDAVSNASDLKIIERIPHPNYNRPIKYDDIGLLKMERKIKLRKAIRPICLPEQSITSAKAIATGWGYDENEKKSNVLMKVRLEMFSQDECVDDYSKHSTYSDGIKLTQVCAGSRDRNNNTCSGDSGGPLQVYHETHFCTYTIIGVTSFGMECDNSNSSSGVYTRVYPYLSWIESIVWPN